MKRLVKDGSFREELSRVTDLKGSAQGRLILGESLSSIKVRAEVSALELSAGYQRIPYRVEIMGGGFSYDEDKGSVSVTNLTGRLGKSSFSGLTAQLGLQKAPFLEVQSGKLLVVLDEIHTWFLSFGETGNRLSKDIRSLKGVLEITELSLQGLLSRPGDWRLETKGNIKELAAEGALLPGPVRITAATL